MKVMYWISLVFVCGAFLSSCSKDYGSGDLYTPTVADTTATASLDELQQGRELYINNCNSCHYLHSPDDYSASYWKSIIPQMAPKTGMNADEVAKVTKYVTRGK
jgi:mono/diheme cytochrome c family protein